MKLPTFCTRITKEEVINTLGGGNPLKTVGKAITVVGVLLCVAGVAARGMKKYRHNGYHPIQQRSLYCHIGEEETPL